MIRAGQGNLLEADAEALVNTVNCVGVMGKGIALQFKQAFPENFRAYQRAVERGEVQPGRMNVFAIGGLTNPRFVLNFPTKRDWRSKSRIEDIRTGLEALAGEIKRLGIRSIAVPPLGCGNGGLDWSEVRPLIEHSLGALPDVDVILFEPGRVPKAESMPVRTKQPKLTRLRAMLLRLMERYRPADPFEVPYRLSKLEIQKLAYFLQETGEPMRLEFIPHRYGPYAEKLNHVLRDLEGHFIRGYGDRSKAAEIWLSERTPAMVAEALADDTAAQEKIDRVTRLIEGFETPHGMELLATVHWVARTDPAAAREVQHAVMCVHRWSERKARIFTPRQVEAGWSRLSGEGWLCVPPDSQGGCPRAFR
jgi:O-acetyl-ADP-ribose deacetylase (regulator of RNase III)